MNNTTQRQFIIKKLQDAGQSGVSSYEFTFEHHIKQCPTRIHELRKLGFNIISKPFKNSVIYVLANSMPSKPTTDPHKPPCEPEDCHDDSHYQEYVKDNRKFFMHVGEVRQGQLSI